MTKDELNIQIAKKALEIFKVIEGGLQNDLRLESFMPTENQNTWEVGLSRLDTPSGLLGGQTRIYYLVEVGMDVDHENSDPILFVGSVTKITRTHNDS